MNAKLKPCPYCGGTKIFTEERQHYSSGDLLAEAICDVTAGGCGHYIEAENLNDAIDKWNAQEEWK